MKNYFYKIEAKFVENGEEVFVKKDFKGEDLFQNRANAFDAYDDLVNAYIEQINGVYSPLETFIKILFVEAADDYEYDDGLKVDFKRIDNFLLYEISDCKLKKIVGCFHFEEEVLREKGVIDENRSLSDLYYYSTETTTIEEIQEKLNSINLVDRRSNFVQIECLRCAKKMEAKSDVSKLLESKKMIYKDAGICCNTCYEVYLSIPKYNFHGKKVYDKNGKSLISNVPDLTVA